MPDVTGHPTPPPPRSKKQDNKNKQNHGQSNTFGEDGLLSRLIAVAAFVPVRHVARQPMPQSIPLSMSTRSLLERLPNLTESLSLLLSLLSLQLLRLRLLPN